MARRTPNGNLYREVNEQPVTISIPIDDNSVEYFDSFRFNRVIKNDFTELNVVIPPDEEIPYFADEVPSDFEDRMRVLDRLNDKLVWFTEAVPSGSTLPLSKIAYVKWGYRFEINGLSGSNNQWVQTSRLNVGVGDFFPNSNDPSIEVLRDFLSVKYNIDYNSNNLPPFYVVEISQDLYDSIPINPDGKVIDRPDFELPEEEFPIPEPTYLNGSFLFDITGIPNRVLEQCNKFIAEAPELVSSNFVPILNTGGQGSQGGGQSISFIASPSNIQNVSENGAIPGIDVEILPLVSGYTYTLNASSNWIDIYPTSVDNKFRIRILPNPGSTSRNGNVTATMTTSGQSSQTITIPIQQNAI